MGLWGSEVRILSPRPIQSGPAGPVLDWTGQEFEPARAKPEVRTEERSDDKRAAKRYAHPLAVLNKVRLDSTRLRVRRTYRYCGPSTVTASHHELPQKRSDVD